MAKLSTIIITLIFVGCDRPEIDRGFSDQEMFWINIYSGIYGEYPTDQPMDYLSVSTDSIYPCCNWEIAVNQKNYEHKTSITLGGIIKPDICLTALGPATYRSPISLSTGEYLIELTNGHTIDEISLIVDDTLIRVAEADTTFTRLVFTEFWRIRENSFYYSCGTMEETAWMYTAFRDSILSIDGIDEFYFGEDGQIPYPRAPMGHYVDHPSKYFTYEKTSQWESVKSKLIAFTQEYIEEHSGVGISVQNWLGDKTLSWMYD